MEFPALPAMPHEMDARWGLILTIAALILHGCNSSTCFVGIINPPSNSFSVTTGNIPSVCSLNQATGAVQVVAQLAPICANCSASRQVFDVHLVVSGVELHPSAVADENSPDWLEIAPDLARRPMSLNLAERSISNAEISTASISGKIPVGTYHQLRLRLTDLASSVVADRPTGGNCESSAAGCVTTADGVRHALRMPDGSQFLRAATSTPLEIRQGQENLLRLELRSEWLLQNSSPGSIEVAPVLRGEFVSQTKATTGTH